MTQTAAKQAKPRKVQPPPVTPPILLATSDGPVQSRVVEVRRSLQLTQQQFATLLGLSTVSVSRWERDHSRPTDSSEAVLELLERALRQCPADLVVDTLRDLQGSTEADRIVALVHLGD